MPFAKQAMMPIRNVAANTIRRASINAQKVPKAMKLLRAVIKVIGLTFNILVGIFGLLVFALVVIKGYEFFLKPHIDGRETEQKKIQADAAADQPGKDSIRKNCEDAVKLKADALTVKFYFRLGRDIDTTDIGFLYPVEVSDASTAPYTIVMLCCTNGDGQVVRVTPQNR